MTVAKRKISVSLDAELLDEMEADGRSLSAQLNEAMLFDLVRRRRERLLGEMLDGLDARFGPADQRLVEKYVELLS